MTSAAHRLIGALALLGAALLASCGGGGDNSSPAAPSALSYPVAPAFVIQKAIAPLTPTVTGMVSSYSVSPALPAGLSLNNSTGVISGTPSAVTAKAAYTVSATNSGGSTTTQVSLVVNDVPPAIAYSSAYFSFTVGIASQTLLPTSSGGTATAWSINPTLPAGLMLDTRTGALHGTPTAASPPVNYAVTASNSGGTVTVALTLAVSAAPLLDLGHVVQVVNVAFSGARVLSQDATGHWALWNYSSGAELARGDALIDVGTQPRIALAGSTAVVQTASGLTVMDASAGTVEGTINTTPSWWQLAADGSYVCAGTSTALTAWTPAGQLLLSRPGDYSAAVAFAAHGQVQVALGGVASGVIQTIDLATAAVSQSPAYQGTFQNWFTDGSGFLTAVSSSSSTVFVYSSSGAQLSILGPVNVALHSFLGGEGNRFWTYDGNINVYTVGGSTTPVFTSAIANAATVKGFGTTLAAVAGNSATLIDLSTATPTSATTTSPTHISALGVNSSTQWVVGDYNGLLIDGASLSGATPRYLDYGAIRNIAGSAVNFAIATASGRILVYDSPTNTLETTINLALDLAEPHVALSSDGSVLAVSYSDPNNNASDVTIYSLPTAAVLNTISLNATSSISMTASGVGTAMQLGLIGDPSCQIQVINVTASAPTWCTTASSVGGMVLSPDGTKTAVYITPPFSQYSTDIYVNGTLSTSVQAVALGWLDNARFLASIYYYNGGNATYYKGASIYGADGTVQSSVPLPEVKDVQVLSANSIYAGSTNVIYAVPSAAVGWESGSPYGYADTFSEPSLGAVSGSEVVFMSRNYLLAETTAAP